MNNQSLTKLIELRKQLNKIDSEIKELMPDAIAEALEINSDRPNSRIIYQQQDGSRIILTLRKCFPTPESDTKLSRLDEDIKAATLELAQRNSDVLEQINSEIEKHQAEIEKLEAKRERLLSDEHIYRLKNEYKIHQENNTYLQPNLSVFLK